MFDDEVNEVITCKYVVTIGMEGGYLPDGIAFFDTLQECYDYALDCKYQWRMNAAWGDYDIHITGNIRKDKMYRVNDGRRLDTILVIDYNPHKTS